MKNRLINYSFILFLLVFYSCNKQPDAVFSPSKTIAETGEQISFVNNTKNGESYYWDFGDGTFSTTESPSKTYTKPGQYQVTLVAYSKKEKKSMSVSQSILIKDQRDKFIGNFIGSGTYTFTYFFSGTTSTQTNTISSIDFVAYDPFNDRISFAGGNITPWYGVITGNTISFPSQVNGSYSLSSGSGALNGTSITCSSSGSYSDGSISGTFSFNFTGSKQ